MSLHIINKIKLFKHFQISTLERDVNEWLEQENEHINVCSIEYQMTSSDHSGYEYSVCIHYIKL
jgi:hypothetical protein